MEHTDRHRLSGDASPDASDLYAAVERAQGYLDAGNVDEAIELLQAVIASGYTGEGARTLLEEAIARQRAGAAVPNTSPTAPHHLAAGSPSNAQQAPSDIPGLGKHTHSTPSPDLRLGPLTVTRPLPGREHLPRELMRALQEADDDIEHRRYESALDLTLHMLGAAADHLPLFVRCAELLTVTGRGHEAAALVRTVEKVARLRGDDTHTLALLRVATHAEPTTENLLELAEASLGQQRSDLAAHYIPAAVTALVEQEDANAALALAKRWQERNPRNGTALWNYVRELLRAGAVGEAAALTHDPDSDVTSLTAALITALATGDERQWSLIQRLSQRAAAHAADAAEIERLLAEAAEALSGLGTLPVMQALIALSRHDHDAVLSLLRGFSSTDPVAVFVASICALRSAAATGNAEATLGTLRSAFDLAQQARVATFLQEHTLFDPPVSLASLGEELAERYLQDGNAHEAATVYHRLVESDPTNHHFIRLHAEAVGRTGDRTAALQQLQALLKREEEARQVAQVEATLQTMVRIAPGHVALRARLIDTYLKRGNVAGAVSELFVQAQLLERHNRLPEAIAQLRRAVEIVTLTGDGSQVDHLYQYMIRLQPQDIGIRHAAAATFVQQGKIKEAIQQLQEAVQIAVVAEDPDEAIAALHQIIALDPSDPGPYHRLGELLASIGEYGQAERVYRRLALLVPDDPAVVAKQTALAALAADQG